MIIYHNIMAQNSHRMLGVNSSTLGKTTEKLSSGLRINRAADDAAGLSISEKMRGQVRGLTQASRNAQDAISVTQTAEGALNEIHDILQRMRELAVQSANDSNVNADRASIQQEVTQLADELDRVSTMTQFNTMNLLDGTFQDKVFHVGANQDQNIRVSIREISAEGLGLRAPSANIDKLRDTLTASIEKLSESIAGREKSIADKKASMDAKLQSIKDIRSSINARKASIQGYLADGDYENAGKAKGELAKLESEMAKFESEVKGMQKYIDDLRSRDAADGKKDSLETLNKEVDRARAAIQANGATLVNEQKTANQAISTIDKAITLLAQQRSELGAIQNRMEHTIKNLDNAAENTQAAESRIRDTDMAKEISEFVKKNVLVQASQAMLAQANQIPNQVLTLLR